MSRSERKGIVRGMDPAEYHGGPEISQSALKAVDQSLGHYRWFRDHLKPVTGRMDKGLAVDCLLSFGEEQFGREYTTPPATPDDLPDWCHYPAPATQRKADKDARAAIVAAGQVPVKESDFDLAGLKMTTNAGKEWKDRDPRRVITASDLHDVRQCVNAIKLYPLAADLLHEADFQVAMFAEILGVPTRGLSDIMGHKQGLIDLKTTEDARPEVFNGKITSLKYHWQAALYLDLAEACGWDGTMEWRWIVAEPEPPYRVEVSTPAPLALLEIGRDEYTAALRKLKAAIKADSWPASTYAPVPYDLRGWKYHDQG